jgi:hypothetical protein
MPRGNGSEGLAKALEVAGRRTVMLNPRWIVGKTVARVDLNPFDDGKGATAHAPVIYFTDGSSISFSTEETDMEGYGISINYLERTGME